MVRIHRRFALLAPAAFILESVLFSTIAALLPHYEGAFGMSTFALGVLAGAYTGGMVVGTLIAGLWLSDRAGVRATALIGCATLAVASVAFGAANSVLVLDLARAVQGVGAGLLWCALLNWLILISPPEARGATIGSAVGAAVFGTALGPLLGAASQLVGAFVVFSAVALAVLALAALLAGVERPAPEAADLPERPLDRLRLPPEPRLRWVAWVGFVPPLIGGAVITLSPLRLNQLGASELGIDLVLLIAALVAAVACAIAGRVADRSGHRAPILAGIAFSVLTLTAMALAAAPVGLAVAFILFEGLGLSFFWIPLMSLFTERGQRAGMSAAGAAMVLNLTITACYTVGPPAVTALMESRGPAAPFLAMAAASMLTLVAAMRWTGFEQRPASEAGVAAEIAG